nr:DNA helicase MCM9 isoform X2 [Nothobranchius furzeri]
MSLRWKPFHEGLGCEVELVLKANNVEVNNQQAAASLLAKDVQRDFDEFWEDYRHDPLAGRNQILMSLCPKVFGMYVVKLAVAMVLAGGVQRVDSSGTKIRGECHMLLVGDPGTGKSQFLKYAAKIISRSVLTAGIGSTSAGLTVAAVKDGGEWHLEAGALVLSDGGLCCIDEFNSIKEHDRISIHEAMEQQSISVAKAGMVCKLNTRTSILAATNPKGQYDSSEPLSVNVALASPLLSRFDLVLVLRDTRNPEWDRIISSFILEDRGPPVESSSLWSMEKMKAYFSIIKQLQPQVSEEAKCILTRYYQLQRQSDGRNAARTTIRMLESLSRLAEAHARLMFREMVTIEDAVTAVSVMECSMQGGALLGNVNALLTSFPDDPVQQYQTQCQILLEGLNLPLLLQTEMDRLSRRRSTMPKTLSSDPAGNQQQQVITTHCESEGGVTIDEWTSSPPSSLHLTSPTITSTQDNVSGKPDNSAVTKESSRQKEERFDPVFPKVSTSLLVLSHQQCDGEVGQGGGTETPSGPLSGKSLHVQRENIAADPGPAVDQRHNLSAFIFRPKRMKPSNAISTALNTETTVSQDSWGKQETHKHQKSSVSRGQPLRPNSDGSGQKDKELPEVTVTDKKTNSGSSTIPGDICALSQSLYPKTSSLNPNTSSLNPNTSSLNPKTLSLNPKTSSLNPKTSSLNPKTSSLNPNTSSLNPNTSSLNPNTSSLNPNTLSLNPKISSLNPKTSSLNPNTSSLNPNTSSLNPNTSSLNPNTSSLNPNTSSLNPKTSSLNPKTSSLNPKTSSLNPNTSSLNPKTLSLNPKTLSLNPKTSSLNPKTSSLNPKTSSLNPNTSSLNPNTSSLNPNTSSLNPNTSSLNPNTSSLNPNTSSLNPNTSSLNPNTLSLNPKISSLNPKTSSLNPNTSSLNPNTSSLNPNTSSLNPNTSSLNPKTLSLNPKTLSLNPKTSSLNPKTSSLNPNTSSLNPNTSSLNTNTSSLNPNTSSLNPNSSSLNPNTSSLNPNTSSLNPNSSSLNPNTSSLNPNTSSLNPNTSSLNPKTSSLNPKTSSLYPKTSSLNPNTSSLNPKTSSLNPNTSSLNPNTSSLNPNTSSLNPNTSSLNPNTSSLNPNTSSLNPNTSSLNPNTSSLNPNTSSLNPNTSSLNPNTSSLNPNTSSLNPNTSSLNPNTSSLNPKTSSLNPNTSSLNPNTPSLNPNTSSLNPNTSSLNPNTSSLNPNTSSLNPNTSSLNPNTSSLNPNTSSLNPNTSSLNPNTSSLNPNTSSLNPNSSPLSPQTPSSRSHHIKAAVAASAFAKLSRFSFSGTTKSTATVQTDEKRGPPQRENTGSVANETASSFRGKPSEALDPAGREKDVLALLLPTAGQPCTSVSSVNPRKRKCFDLGRPPTGPKHFLSELSLFGSAEVFNDVLDTDWDHEVLKS